MLTQNEIIRVTRATLLRQGPRRSFSGVSIDSRTLKPGDLFIAIQGQRFDGHQFISQALSKGAGGIMISRKFSRTIKATVLAAKDTTKALGQIAGFHRARFAIPLIAVTGSAGKTSTKESIAALLGSKFNVLKSKKTENNQFGVPLTLLQLSEAYEVAVIELGTNSPGEIAWLSRVAQPTVAVFTNIGDSHLQGLKTPRGVFREKSQMLRYLSLNGSIIYNADDPYLRELPLAPSSGRQWLSYSIKKPSDFQAKNIVRSELGKVAFTVHRKRVHLSHVGNHMIYNALAAICCGRLFKIHYNTIDRILSEAPGFPGRQKIEKVGEHILIDDTYNANPVSMTSAMDTLDVLPAPQKMKRVLICADMLELGRRTKVLHEAMADRILKSSLDVVLTIGTASEAMTRRIMAKDPHVQAFHARTFAQIYAKLRHWVVSPSVVLVKGSRSMQMEKVVEYFKKQWTSQNQ